MAVIAGWYRSLAREEWAVLRGETGAHIFLDCHQRRLFLFGNTAVESLSLWYCGGLTFSGSCQYLSLALSRAHFGSERLSRGGRLQFISAPAKGGSTAELAILWSCVDKKLVRRHVKDWKVPAQHAYIYERFCLPTLSLWGRPSRISPFS
jgi:hypothetical protein